ncbi:MAG: hypothetical protein Q8865_08890, partial [Bacillota bacterium]|nr:hypothetical protein [Bacillota bacterium]
AGDSSTKIATTAFVASANAASATKLATARAINGVAFDGTANITVADSTKAPLASPALTGTPTAPTPIAGDNSTKIATTAFVNVVANGINGIKTYDPANINNIIAPGLYMTSSSGETEYMNINILFVAVDCDGASTPSKIFQEQFTYKSKDDPYYYSLLYRTSSDGGKTWDNWRVHALPPATTTSLGVVQLNDTLTSTSSALALTANQGCLLQNTKAPLASPAFTGTPTAPTPGQYDRSTKIATTDYVLTAINNSKPDAGYTGTINPTTYACEIYVENGIITGWQCD